MLRIPWGKSKSDSDTMSDALARSTETAMSIEGQMTSNEVRTLIELANNIPDDRVIVEIGTYRGRSAVGLGLGSKLGNRNRVYAVDPHVEFRGIRGGEFGPQDQSELYNNLFRAGIGDIVAVVSLNSVAAAKAWTRRDIGLLWLDGDHRYEAVRADYEAWQPFLAHDALVAFHDTDLPDVQHLLVELTEKGELILGGKTEGLSWFTRGRR